MMAEMKCRFQQHAADDDRVRSIGPIEMGSMFTLMKVREGARGNGTRILALTRITRNRGL